MSGGGFPGGPPGGGGFGPPGGNGPPGGYGPPPGGGFGPPAGQGPPGAYGPPPGAPGGYGPANPGGHAGYPGGYGGPPRPLRPGAMLERNPVMVLLLIPCTCLIYYFYWIYKTSFELKEALDDQEINPTTDLLLSIVTCTVWGIIVQYRNAQKVHAALLPREPQRKDQTQTILVLLILGTFSGVASLIGAYLVQEEYNALAKAAG